MKYEKIWTKILNPNEDIKHEFSIGNRYLKVQLFAWFVLAVFLLCIWISLFPLSIFLMIIGVAQYFYIVNSNAYAFTNKRVLIHTGWLSTKATSVNFDKITEVTVVEPYLTRILTKTGELSIHTANMIDGLHIKNIENPYELKKKLDALRNQ